MELRTQVAPSLLRELLVEKQRRPQMTELGGGRGNWELTGLRTSVFSRK